MATKKSTSKATKRGTAAPSLDALAASAQKAFASGKGMKALQKAVVDALRASAGAEQMWSILTIEGLDQATYVEDEHPPAVAEALLARAIAWGDSADAAGAIALAVRASAFDPAPTLLREMDEGVKDAFARVLEAHLDELEARLASPCAPLRAASAHALGRCRTATPAQARTLLDRASRESDPSAKAAMLLSIGAIARRRADRSLEVPAIPPGEPVLVRACGAAARALAGARLDEDATAALADAVASPVEVPPAWGWRWQDGGETSAAIGVRLFAWIETDAPGRAVDALARMPSPTWRVPDALGHLAFADGARVPQAGLAREELDELQRRALAVFGQRMQATPWLRRFALYDEQNVPLFLEGKPPHWKPLDVAWKGGRRWHLWRVWREHMWSDLPRDVAVTAIVGGLGGDAALDAITSRFHGLYTNVEGRAPGAHEQARDGALVEAVVEAAARAGTACMDLLVRFAATPAERHATTLALALLAAARATRMELPADLDPVLRNGVRFAATRAVFGDLLDTLPAARRASIAPPTT